MPILDGGGAVRGGDLSSGMLRRAQRRVARAGWSDVHLLERDATTLTSHHLSAALGRPVELDGVLVTLGLSVIPGWESVFDHTWSLLRPGGRYVIMDAYAERWVPQSTVVSLMAQADLHRRTWERLEAVGDECTVRWLPGSPHVHGGRLFLAAGTRR